MKLVSATYDELAALSAKFPAGHES